MTVLSAPEALASTGARAGGSGPQSPTASKTLPSVSQDPRSPRSTRLPLRFIGPQPLAGASSVCVCVGGGVRGLRSRAWLDTSEAGLRGKGAGVRASSVAEIRGLRSEGRQE